MSFEDESSGCPGDDGWSSGGETATGDINVSWPGATGVGLGCTVAPKAANLKRPSRDAPTFSMEATQLGGQPVGPPPMTAPGWVEETPLEQTALETIRLLG